LLAESQYLRYHSGSFGEEWLITSEQIRAARAMIRWEQRDLADASGVSLPSVKRLETSPGPLAAQPKTSAALKSALELAGIEFTNGVQPGVRLKAVQIAMTEEAFKVGLTKFGPMLRANAQFGGLRLVREGPTMVKLVRLAREIGQASQRNGLALFNPGVAHEGVDETKVEYIFADWAGAAIRRADRASD
jgi:transcriptional regulator with XRE-family HTH domain